MAQTHVYKRRQFEWYDVVRLCGPEGEAWMDEYQRFRGIPLAIARALEVNRKGDLATGTALLDQAWDDLQAAGIGDPTITAVIERWYYGALGYSQYRLERYEEAEATMCRGQQVVMGALPKWFLVFLADETVDFHMHRARIARNQQRWGALREHLAIARAMRAGTVPYHVTEDGRAVDVDDVRAFFAALPVPEGVTLIAPHLQDPAFGTRDLDLIEREILRIPGMVIHQA
jgi:hypothetical protein